MRTAIPAACLALLLFTAHLAWAADLTARYRQRESGQQSVLIGVDSETPIDEVKVKLPRRFRRSAQLGNGPDNWQLEQEKDAIRVFGQAISNEPIRIRIDIGDGKLPAQTTVSLGRGGAVIEQQVLRPETSQRVAVARSLSELLLLPPLIEAGEQIEFTPIDVGRTPPEGRWTIAGAVAQSADEGRLIVEVPDQATPGESISVRYENPWGETTVLVDDAAGTRIVTPPEYPEEGPRISGCSRRTFIGRIACVCGSFPQGSRTDLTLDGEPLGQPLSASRRVLHYRLPDGTAPGAHIIEGSSQQGFSASDQAMLVALRVNGTIDQDALIRGESTQLHMEIEGASEPLILELANRTPGVISIEGGDFQSIETSGGSNNQLTKRVDALSRGNFDIRYSLAESDCPCSETEMTSRTPEGYIPRRVLASVPGAAPAALLATAQAIAATVGLTLLEATPLNAAGIGLIVFEIPDARTVPVVILALNADARVQFAQPDYVYDTHGQVVVAAAEPYESLSYGVRLVGADRVQDLVSGRGTRVALIDTGVDTDHVDLVGQISESRDFSGRGFSPDIHGTQVAGILAAKSGDGAGISGIAPGVTLLALKACQPSSTQSVRARCWSSALVKGIDYAVEQRVDIINLSVGGRREDQLLSIAVETATGHSTTVVAAAGNDGPSGSPSYPAALPGVVAVTAVDVNQRIYSHATQGAFVDVSAPGVEIVSTAPGNQFPICSGTSFATAYVTGILALLHERSPSATAAATVSALEASAIDLGAAGRDPLFGSGLVNACGALRLLNPDAPACN